LIGGVVDLDLLSLFPKKKIKNHGRNQEIGQALQGKQWRREKSKEHLAMGKKGAFYRCPRNLVIAQSLTPEISAYWSIDSGLTRRFRPNLRLAPVLAPV
jgi:hypothetical protein